MNNGRGILDTLRKEKVSEYIENCYDHEQSDLSGRVYDVDNHIMTTPEFAEELKLTFPTILSDFHKKSVANALNSLMRQRHGSFAVPKDDEPEILDEPAEHEITIPNGVSKFIIRTRDPETEILFARTLGKSHD